MGPLAGAPPVRAGIDLLLSAAERPAQRRIEMTLRAAEARGLFEPGELEASSARLADLRSWLAAAGPSPDVRARMLAMMPLVAIGPR